MLSPKPISKAAALRFWAFFALSLVFLAVFATVSSPFSTITGIDYGIFRTMGQCWFQGDVIYRDLFDSKGPYLFFIQMVAQCLSPQKWSIFVLEALNMAVCLQLLFAMGRTLRVSTPRIYGALTCFLAFFAITVEWGNTVEEWSLPFVLLPMWLCLRYLMGGSTVHPYKYSLVYGACFGIIALMRVNNAAIIVGIILGLAGIYIWHRRFRGLMANAAYVMAGIALGMLPAILFFWYHGALYDMIYATFIYNVKYRQNWGVDSDLRLWINGLRMVVCLCVVVAVVVFDRRRHSCLAPVVVPMALVSFLTFFDGTTYLHYFTMVSPLVFLTAVFCVSLRWYWQVLIAVVTIAPLLRDWDVQRRMLKVLYLQDNLFVEPSPHDLLTKQFSVIPEADYHDIYLYDPYCTYNGILYPVHAYPIGKYFTQQSGVARLDPYVRRDIVESFVKAQPKWIISGYPIEDTMLNDVASGYVLVMHCPTSLPWYNNFLYRRADYMP